MSRSVRSDKSILRAEELSVFSRELCALLRAGMPLPGALTLLGEECLPRHRALLEALSTAMQEGAALDRALTDSRRFPPYYVDMIAIAQRSGRLEQALLSLGEYYESREQTRQALRRAVAYPGVMLLVTLAVLLVLLTQVLPIFQQVLWQLGAELPPVAQALLRAGQYSQVLSGVFFALVLLSLALALFFTLTPPGRRLAPGLLRKTVLHGRLGTLLARSQFVDALELMLTSGLHPDEALEQCESLLAKTPLETCVPRCRQLLGEGQSLAAACRDSGLLTAMQAGVLGAGMLSGSGDEAVRQLSERCRQQAQQQLETSLSRVEPMMLLVLAVAVGLILLSVMLPLLGMMTAFGS